MMMTWLIGFSDNAAFWEEFYAKEIVRIIDSADPGQEVFLDMTKATALAVSEGVSKSEIVIFDNVQNRVRVKLTNDGGTHFAFFNDVDIVNWRLEIPSPGTTPNTNRLYFEVTEVHKQNVQE